MIPPPWMPFLRLTNNTVSRVRLLGSGPGAGSAPEACERAGSGCGGRGPAWRPATDAAWPCLGERAGAAQRGAAWRRVGPAPGSLQAAAPRGDAPARAVAKTVLPWSLFGFTWLGWCFSVYDCRRSRFPGLILRKRCYTVPSSGVRRLRATATGAERCRFGALIRGRGRVGRPCHPGAASGAETERRLGRTLSGPALSVAPYRRTSPAAGRIPPGRRPPVLGRGG